MLIFDLHNYSIIKRCRNQGYFSKFGKKIIIWYYLSYLTFQVVGIKSERQHIKEINVNLGL
jgi:hypothetical protein